MSREERRARRRRILKAIGRFFRRRWILILVSLASIVAGVVAVIYFKG